MSKQRSLGITSILSATFNSKDKEFKKQVRNLAGIIPGNIELYRQAFRHNSVVDAANSKSKISNERLEFLGDAVLGMVVGEFLYYKYPKATEGFLTEMRSKMVSREQLSELAHKMGVSQMLEFDKSLRGNNMVLRSLSGNAFEAVIGAIYLDKGFEKAKKFIIKRIINTHLDVRQLEDQNTNYKGTLLNWAQRNKKKIEYELIETKTRKNLKLFVMGVKIDDELMGKGEDFSKKKAEQLASQEAIKTLGVEV